MLDKVKPAAIGARPASVSVNFWQPDGADDNPSQFSRQVTRAESRGDDICDACRIRSSAAWLVLAGSHGRLQGDYRAARTNAQWLAQNLGLPTRSAAA